MGRKRLVFLFSHRLIDLDHGTQQLRKIDVGEAAGGHATFDLRDAQQRTESRQDRVHVGDAPIRGAPPFVHRSRSSMCEFEPLA